MTQPDDPNPHADWSQVGAAITALGDRIQAHFSGLTANAPAPDSAAPFEELGKSLDEALTSFRNAVSDPQIAAAAKSAADEFLAALKTEVDSASDTVGDVISRTTEKVDEIGDDEPPSGPGELPPA